ncbi:MAG: hypothetical protein AB1758_22195 [Candidatus Eremiobacterota bacterium]
MDDNAQLLLSSLVALSLGVVTMLVLTVRRRLVPEHDEDQTVRLAVIRLFQLAARGDHEGAATLLAYTGSGEARSGDVLHFSRPEDAEEVARRCKELQELTRQGGMTVDQVRREGDACTCQITFNGPTRLTKVLTMRRARERWALYHVE